MRLARTLALFFTALVATLASAQTVRWETDANQPNVLMLVFQGCTPSGEIPLPPIAGATLDPINRSDQTTIINNQVSRSVVQLYVLRARQRGAVQIPAFSVATDKGTLQVQPFSTSPTTVLESVANAKLILERTTVWAGEIFGLSYVLDAAQRTNPQVNPTFDWNPAPLIAEDWAKPEVAESSVGGERRVSVTFRTHAMGKSPNTVRLEPTSHMISVQTGTVGGGFLMQPRMTPVSVVSDQPTIEIKPLPPSPAGFTGAVGQFKLVSKVVPETAAVGEPVTWTLELSGIGNWPEIAGLPSRDVSNDFEVVQPKAKRIPAEGRLFDVTLAEDVVLVPTKAGSYTLGPLNFVYFDPASGTYKTLSAPRTTVSITGPVGSVGGGNRPAPVNGNESDINSDGTGRGTRPPPPVPGAPTGIPRDPLPGADRVGAPMTFRAVAWASAAPLAAVLAFWLYLATARARLTDPARPRREARQRLARTLSHLQTAPEAERAALLLGWQHDTSVLWQIPHAAPPATALPDAAWSTLWRESDRALYGAQPVLPGDWIARAQEALAAKQVPGFKPQGLFLPRNLFPFAASLALVGLVVLPMLAAAALSSDPIAAYQRGDFAAAEKSWRTVLTITPTDWITRHNLSLALAQQERPGEAAGQAVAAFVQQPGNPSVRWHFALATQKAGFSPAPVAAFLSPGPAQAIARLASPAVWQRWVILAAVGTALALGIVLFNSYRRRTTGGYLTGAILGALSLALGGVALTGALAYGMAADTRAMLVARSGTLRSIPTEVDTTQKTTELPAGAMGLATKTFLGWTQLEFENGQTGWVRKEEIVPLWQ